MASNSIAKRVWLLAAAVLVIGAAVGGATLFFWTIGENHFDRPDKRFDRLAAQLEALPGVSVDGRERWVEAPTFSNPRSWIQLSVDEADLPGLLSTACDNEYPDALSWSFEVHAKRGNVVSLYSLEAPGDRVDGTPCPYFGFDAVGLVDEVGKSGSGANLQAAIWDSGRFALVVLDDEPGPMSAMLPLVGHAEGMREAAGIDERQSVEINASSLSVTIRPGEHGRYLTLLSSLVEDNGVTSFWADGDGIPVDGIDRVQVTAPAAEHAEITRAIRASGLHVADFPVDFIPLGR